MLVGSDFFRSNEVIQEGQGLVAINSKLGWLLSGPLNSFDFNHLTACNVIVSGDYTDSKATYEFEQPEQLEDIVRSFWMVEAVGILDDKAVPLNEFIPDSKFNEGRYEVQLPWK